jgi:hypothetical protein
MQNVINLEEDEDILEDESNYESDYLKHLNEFLIERNQVKRANDQKILNNILLKK